MTIVYYEPKAKHSGIDEQWLYGLDIIRELKEEFSGHQWIALNGLAYDELAEIYKKADLLIRPTRHDGWPCMVLEALHFGCEVICTVPSIGGIVISVDRVKEAFREWLESKES